MRGFNLSLRDRMALKGHHREFHAAVGELASSKLDLPWDYQGIFKYEGGVRINEREIAIHRDFVVDDWKKGREATREELAVAQAIEEIVARFKREGAAMFAPFRGKRVGGDPLNSLLLSLG